VCEKARTVTSVCTSGTLCTTSKSEGIEGAPFGSYVDFVLDDVGNPVLLMNAMSMHTVNIRESADYQQGRQMATLFAQLAGQSSSGGQDVSRCSITGTIEKIPPGADDMAQIRLRYSITHAYADRVMDSPKFDFYRLRPAKIYYVGGFGVQSEWVPVEEYQNARPDVLARHAADIVQKLNRDSEDDLILVAKHLLDTPNLEEIKVTSVDRLGMDVRVTNRVSKKKLTTNEYRIGFRIPVISIEDAKSEILKVFQEAWEKGQGFEWDLDDELPGSSVPIIKVAEDSLG
jgi:putative heme iron utilization protein